MNTTTHPLTTYWLVHDRPHAIAAAIASFVPDAAYLVALAAGLVSRLPAIVSAVAGSDWSGAGTVLGGAVWATWSNPVANFFAQKILHNLVLATAFALVALLTGRGVLRAVALGWMLHVWTDLTFHAADAYAVLWPFTSRVFPSPISYWDPNHHGRVVGGVLALLALALWVWIAKRAQPDTRGRIAAALCMLMGVASLAGATFGPPPETRRSDAWVDDGIEWTDETAPIAALIAQGDTRGALDAIRTTPMPPDDRSLPPWSRNRARARQQLLQAYAQDLEGNREQALVSYALAERLETVGGVGDKARRYSAEPFTNTPDPAVSGTWLVLFLWGMGASATLLWRVRARVATIPGGSGGNRI